MKIFTDSTDPEIIERLQRGEVGVIPSDTIYGLMCIADNPEPVDLLYRLKQRENKPGTLIGANINQFITLGLDKDQLEQANQYWPGPVSVVIPCDSTLNYLHLGKESLAVRIPAKPDLQQMLEQTGVLQTTSANVTKQPAASTLAEAQAYFGETVDFYVDGGDLSSRQPTTVIRIEDGVVEVLREGAQQVVS